MNVPSVAHAALRAAGLSEAITSSRELSGGCIHHVVELALDDGRSVVAKFNHASMLGVFQEEMFSLQSLAATNTVAVPMPYMALANRAQAVLLMSKVEAGIADAQAWRRFGQDLAALHAAPVADLYGFDMDNHIGSTRQVNSWMDDWVEFNAVNRLGFQLELAREHNRLEPDEMDRVDAVISRLDRLIPRKPRPSLLHGDLWSGNALPAFTEQGRDRRSTCAVIDPACSVGDALADVAMMQLFGGFAPECFDAYQEAAGIRLKDDDATTSVAVYQLYHMLNHVNLFSGGYKSQAMQLIRRLGS